AIRRTAATRSVICRTLWPSGNTMCSRGEGAACAEAAAASATSARQRRRTASHSSVRAVKAAVVGGGSWGTAVARLRADRQHEVTLVCRDPEQAAAIAETGRNPRYLIDVDLRDVAAAHEAPAGADVYVLAIPSRAFAEVVAGLPPGGAALSLTKGLDPGS